MEKNTAKIGTPEEAQWDEIAKRAEVRLQNLRKEMDIAIEGIQKEIDMTECLIATAKEKTKDIVKIDLDSTSGSEKQ